MDLSIVIPVSNDTRIRRSINSIDETVEVIAALNKPSKEVREIVKSAGIKSAEISKNNLGMAYNAGLDAASNEHVLFMDSDCVFQSGTIYKLFNTFAQNPEQYLARGYVVYKSNSLSSELVRRARTVNTSGVDHAFIPALMLRQGVFNEISDGYRFAEDLSWCVDFEFDLRRRKAGIPLTIIPDARIYHDPLPITSDLRSAFKYGLGKRMRHERTGTELSFKSDIIGTFNEPVLRGLREEGLITASYMAFWEGTQILGYLAKKYLGVGKSDQGDRK